MAIRLKTVTVDGKTYAEVVDDKPVYIHDDGKEHPFDAIGAATRISALNAEAKNHREAKEAAETSLKKFEGIDADKAKKALETVQNLDDKKLVDAGQVEQIKNAAIAAVEDKYKPVVEERDSLKRDIFGERLGNRFAHSKLIADKMAVPADVVQAVFGKYFKDENGVPVAYGPSGNKIYSRQNPGADPDFDEALQELVDLYPHKDTLLKGTGGGSGGHQNGGGRQAGAKEIKRSDFDALSMSDRTKTIKEGVRVVD